MSWSVCKNNYNPGLSVMFNMSYLVRLIQLKLIKDANSNHFRFMHLSLPHLWTVDSDGVVVVMQRCERACIFGMYHMLKQKCLMPFQMSCISKLATHALPKKGTGFLQGIYHRNGHSVIITDFKNTTRFLFVVYKFLFLCLL